MRRPIPRAGGSSAMPRANRAASCASTPCGPSGRSSPRPRRAATPSACRAALDAFEAASGSLGKVALPPRIEHAQLVHPEDQPRFALLGVAASMQPIHCTSDIELAERWWKSRAPHAYPWRALTDQGVLLAFGSDAPVEFPSVAHGLHAAVTRQRPDATPPGGF